MSLKVWSAAAFSAAVVVLLAPLASLAQAPATSNGEALFTARCKGCHDPAQGRAPPKAALAVLPADQIVTVLTTGVMQPMAAGLSDQDKASIAQYLTSAPAAGPEAHPATPTVQAAAPRAPRPALPANVGTDPVCTGAAPPIRETPADWSSVGVDSGSRRFQQHPGLTPASAAKLKLKWSFAMVGGGMPTVVGDWLFTTNRNGRFYALDAKTGCVRWAVDGVAARTTPMIVKSSISPSGWATFVGDRSRTVRAFDAATGKEIWRSEELEKNPVAGVTGAPVVSGDQLFVPMSSGEEGAAAQPKYPCCSFRGSLSALDLKTGKLQWKTFVINEPLHPTHLNSAGVQLQGPAGGAIWSAPTVDAKRGLVYMATGDSYTDADTKGDDAIVAMEMATGKIRWSTQVTAGDNFIIGCGRKNEALNCPHPGGPDYDFGSSPILFKLASGKDMLLAGQKSGIAYGLNPDTGKVLWSTKVGSGSALGGIEWGMAADGKRLYVAISDIINLFAENTPADQREGEMRDLGPAKPGLYALDPATGKILWSTPSPAAPCHYATPGQVGSVCIRAQSAAPSVIPGVVFSGTTDGWFRAYDAATGKIIWADSTTAQTYATLNGVKAQPGGSIDGLGPTVANGMVYVMSGFNGAARTGSNGVNVLLAYSVDGK